MPRIKHTAVKQSKPTASDESEGYEVFVDAEAAARYSNVTALREPHAEKGFTISSKASYGLPAEIAVVIDQHKWKRFAGHPTGFCTSFVREFYANIGGAEQTHSMVRGCKVSFSAKTINLKLNLAEEDDEYQPLLTKATVKQLTDMKDAVTVPGTKWLPTSGNQLKIARSALQPFAKVWYHFLRHKLSPTAHTETVKKERLVLLYCIMEGKKINVGRLIQQEISTCATSTKGQLVFPCFITDLCKRCGVELRKGEVEERNAGSIDIALINRFISNSAKASQAKDQERIMEPGEPSKQQDRSAGLEQKVESLTQMLQQQMLQQQLYWQFALDQFKWQQRVLELNQWKKVHPIPQFPLNILPDLHHTPGQHNSPSATAVPDDSDSSDWMPPAPSQQQQPTTTTTEDISRNKRKRSASPLPDLGAETEAEPEETEPEATTTTPTPSRAPKKKIPATPLRDVITKIAADYPASDEDEEDNVPLATRKNRLPEQSAVKGKGHQPSTAESEGAGGSAEDTVASATDEENQEDLVFVKEVGTSTPTSKKTTTATGSKKSSRIRKLST